MEITGSMMKKQILLLFILSLVITLYHAHSASKDFYPNDMNDDTIIIAVLDDGINPKFDKINDYIFFNSNEIPHNGLDDDANGYIDDVHGWDFVNNDNTTFDNSKFDYHGTAMADLIVRYGSQNIRLLPDYPSSFDIDNILSVTTLNQNLSLWEWSNFGSTNVDIGVIGVDIPTFNSYSEKYELGSGTSISTAILTGYASTILENGSYDLASLKQEIFKNATQMDNLEPYINRGRYLHVLEKGAI